MAVLVEHKFQLWCYYEAEDRWKMEGFFNSSDFARTYLDTLRNDVETPCMPTWEITTVEVVVGKED